MEYICQPYDLNARYPQIMIQQLKIDVSVKNM